MASATLHQDQFLQEQIEKFKPSPALNVYNIFFLIERRRILENRYLSMADIRRILVENRQQGALKKKKRIHRKTHGMVGFKELTNTIASRWKTIDGATRHSLDKLAALDRIHYRKQLKAWNELKKAMKTSMSTMFDSSALRMDAAIAYRNNSLNDAPISSHEDTSTISSEQEQESPEECAWTETFMYLNEISSGIDLLSPMAGEEMEYLFSE